ncbi:MAG TPA: DUF523 domain-containing protein [Lachnospiraceae bacterium]|nr:DUF523 domain-containing protein [Lachnospiraceae bacterium]
MKILVSACLLGENCKYNGTNNYNEKVAEFVKGHEVITVCPEVLGGLPVPRVPSEIVGGTVMTRECVSVDEEFRRGAHTALKQALDGQVDMAILQSRSPSCGVLQIYDGSFSGKLIEGQGIFARLLKDAGIRLVDAEEISHLLPPC